MQRRTGYLVRLTFLVAVLLPLVVPGFRSAVASDQIYCLSGVCLEDSAKDLLKKDIELIAHPNERIELSRLAIDAQGFDLHSLRDEFVIAGVTDPELDTLISYEFGSGSMGGTYDFVGNLDRNSLEILSRATAFCQEQEFSALFLSTNGYPTLIRMRPVADTDNVHSVRVISLSRTYTDIPSYSVADLVAKLKKEFPSLVDKGDGRRFRRIVKLDGSSSSTHEPEYFTIDTRRSSPELHLISPRLGAVAREERLKTLASHPACPKPVISID
jgi:hypothetical protein